MYGRESLLLLVLLLLLPSLFMERRGGVEATIFFFMIESILFSFYRGCVTPLDGRELVLLRLSLSKEDELVSCRLWSRVVTTPRPPPPSSLSSKGEGRRSRSDSLVLLVENIFSSALLFL